MKKNVFFLKKSFALLFKICVPKISVANCVMLLIVESKY